MQEEVNQKTVALAVQTARFSGNTMKKAIISYLAHRKAKQVNSKSRAQAKQREPTHGKMTVEELVGQGQGATNIEIKDKDIRLFENIARKYNVDYAVKKDQTVNPPRYLIFFKARDTDVIAQAFKEYVHVSSKRKERPSLKAKLVRLQKSLSKAKNRERAREKDRGRGAPSL